MQKIFRVITMIVFCLWGDLSVFKSYGAQPLSDSKDPRLFQSSQAQIEEYNAQRAKSVIELQQFRQTFSLAIQNDKGTRGTATLMNLNPLINTWFLLTVTWTD